MSKNYLNNEDLLNALRSSKIIDKLNIDAIQLFNKMIVHIGTEFSYEYSEDREDCAAEAIYNVLKYWRDFDETRTTNAFSYFTQAIKNGYAIGLNKLYPWKKRYDNVSMVALNSCSHHEQKGYINNI